MLSLEPEIVGIGHVLRRVDEVAERADRMDRLNWVRSSL
jgi:hypothetical protein